MIELCSIIIGLCIRTPLPNWICPHTPSMWIGVCMFPIAPLSVWLFLRQAPQPINCLNLSCSCSWTKGSWVLPQSQWKNILVHHSYFFSEEMPPASAMTISQETWSPLHNRQLCSQENWDDWETIVVYVPVSSHSLDVCMSFCSDVTCHWCPSHWWLKMKGSSNCNRQTFLCRTTDRRDDKTRVQIDRWDLSCVPQDQTSVVSQSWMIVLVLL